MVKTRRRIGGAVLPWTDAVRSGCGEFKVEIAIDWKKSFRVARQKRRTCFAVEKQLARAGVKTATMRRAL